MLCSTIERLGICHYAPRVSVVVHGCALISASSIVHCVGRPQPPYHPRGGRRRLRGVLVVHAQFRCRLAGRPGCRARAGPRGRGADGRRRRAHRRPARAARGLARRPLGARRARAPRRGPRRLRGPGPCVGRPRHGPGVGHGRRRGVAASLRAALGGEGAVLPPRRAGPRGAAGPSVGCGRCSGRRCGARARAMAQQLSGRSQGCDAVR